MPIAETGLPPHFPFWVALFVNGGAMRIAPLAIAYRAAGAVPLRAAVEAAIVSSHRHPEAIDFAVVQAATVQYALSLRTPDAFDTVALLRELATRCTTNAMHAMLADTDAALAATTDGDGDLPAVTALVAAEKRPGTGMSFQIASVPCVFWCACRYAADPRRAIQSAIALGGDTDTTAAMIGAIVGALHGEGEWCAAWAAREWPAWPRLRDGPRRVARTRGSAS